LVALVAIQATLVPVKVNDARSPAVLDTLRDPSEAKLQAEWVQAPVRAGSAAL
jgi:hypothetical protein